MRCVTPAFLHVHNEHVLTNSHVEVGCVGSQQLVPVIAGKSLHMVAIKEAVSNMNTESWRYASPR